MPTQIQRLTNWRTALGELVIVVIGVIIALGVDSWWSDLQDATAERGHLVALSSEFSTNQETLESNIATLQRIKGSARELLLIAEGEESLPPPDSMVVLTWSAFSFPPYEPVVTAYQNLVNTGDIQLIQDDSLKQDLALFMSQIERYRRGEWQLEQWNRVIQQFVTAKMEPLDWLPALYRAQHGLPDPRVRTDWTILVRDQEFKGILVNRVIAAQDNIRNLQRVLPTTERVVARLVESLRSSGNGAS